MLKDYPLTFRGLQRYGYCHPVGHIFGKVTFDIGIKPQLCFTGYKERITSLILACLDCSSNLITIVCTLQNFSPLPSLAFSHKLFAICVQQVEARIVVLAVLRMIKENYHTHGMKKLFQGHLQETVLHSPFKLIHIIFKIEIKELIESKSQLKCVQI